MIPHLPDDADLWDGSDDGFSAFSEDRDDQGLGDDDADFDDIDGDEDADLHGVNA